MAIITDITKQRRTQSYNIYIDYEYAFLCVMNYL